MSSLTRFSAPRWAAEAFRVEKKDTLDLKDNWERVKIIKKGFDGAAAA